MQIFQGNKVINQNNNISCFQHLPSILVNWSLITELDLRGNPWICDCDLAWIGGDKMKHLHKQDGLSQVCAPNTETFTLRKYRNME